MKASIESHVCFYVSQQNREWQSVREVHSAAFQKESQQLLSHMFLSSPEDLLIALGVEWSLFSPSIDPAYKSQGRLQRKDSRQRTIALLSKVPCTSSLLRTPRVSLQLPVTHLELEIDFTQNLWCTCLVDFICLKNPSLSPAVLEFSDTAPTCLT